MNEYVSESEELSRIDDAAFHILLDLYHEFHKAGRMSDIQRSRTVSETITFIEDQYPLAYKRVNEWYGDKK